MSDPTPRDLMPADRPEQHQRALALQALYLLDGRHRPDHPMHGLYTGLHEQRLAHLRELLGREPTTEEINRDRHLLTARVPF